MTQNSAKWRSAFSRHPLLTFGAMYLAVIAVFALAYWYMPGQFYHSTSMFEPQLKSEVERIRSGLETAMIDQFHKNFHRDTIPFRGSELDIKSLKIVEIFYERKRFAIRFLASSESFTVISQAAEVDPRNTSSFSIKSLEHDEVAINAHAGMDMIGDIIHGEPQEGPWFRDLFTIRDFDGSRYLGYVTVSTSLHHLMLAYADAQDGFAGKATGSFWRMLYLSTVTITTLGYGDIVPITPLARTLIAIEAVLGMVVIGLYLNALTRRVEMTK